MLECTRQLDQKQGVMLVVNEYKYIDGLLIGFDSLLIWILSLK